MVGTTGFLDVPGARLRYEVRGDGPPLVLLHGNTGDGDVFQFLAAPLAQRYTVITYDARGNSRSALTIDNPGPQPVRERADDALAIIDALTDEPPCVFGNSGGAITALDLLSRYPDRVRLVIAHEPPMFTVLPDAADHAAFFADVHATFLREGTDAAFEKFGAGIGIRAQNRSAEPTQLPPAIGEMRARMHANLPFFLGSEMLDVVGYQPDVPALAKSADRLIFGIGADSRAFRPALPALEFAPTINAELVEFPGDHAGYLGSAEPFVTTLLNVLAARSITQ
ncbi:alpha/beta hydrolase [Nocardia sp. NPDC006630]|uniref:alpha/beta fold hydrolase n=1 Tax=Nocardia sp. NPDC006630 TaxID=3157181 RepID=UPI0033B59DCC